MSETKKGGGKGKGGKKAVSKKSGKTAAKKGKGRKKANTGPKRAKSAYLYFSMAMRPEVKSANPDEKFGAIAKILGEKWKELSEEDKKPYQALAAKDKERYENDKKKAESKPEEEEEQSGSDDEQSGSDDDEEGSD